MAVYSKVIFVKKIEKGRSVSYGRTFIAKKNMRVATLAIGYADGYLRILSNKACVLINGARCLLLGRVTMDQIVVDVTHVKGITEGTRAVILGRSKDKHITADRLANWAGTINYEIVCSLGSRLKRIYR